MDKNSIYFGAEVHTINIVHIQFEHYCSIRILSNLQLARRYYGVPIQFCFLRLLICLSSAGNLPKLRLNGSTALKYISFRTLLFKLQRQIY